MSLEAITLVAQIAGIVGVIASLAYLAVQVRQNTLSVRSATYDSLVRHSGDFLLPLIEDPALAEAFERGVEAWSALTSRDQARVNYLFTQLFRTWENVFYQHRQGTLEAGLWASWRHVMISYFHQPGVHDWWQHRGQAYSVDFRSFLEGSTPVAGAIQTTEQLRKHQLEGSGA